VDISEVVAHYEAMHEDDRLASGPGALELVRTREILRRHLPSPPARVLDVGGGTGVHADWLLADGYRVHLLDITPRHVQQALDRLAHRRLSVALADGRRLPVGDETHDVVLVLGPLYHLPDKSDRLAVLREARRAVRQDGLVAVAAISRFASLFDGLVREFLFEPEFREIVRRDLTEGTHVNPSQRPQWSTTAYFHHPAELAEELMDARLTMRELVGVEGMPGWLSHLDRRWGDESDRSVILAAVRSVETNRHSSGSAPISSPSLARTTSDATLALGRVCRSCRPHRQAGD
jgi:ubiquinone/menaquinone biosynthesis C-methylase UbiE